MKSREWQEFHPGFLPVHPGMAEVHHICPKSIRFLWSVQHMLEERQMTKAQQIEAAESERRSDGSANGNTGDLASFAMRTGLPGSNACMDFAFIVMSAAPGLATAVLALPKLFSSVLRALHMFHRSARPTEPSPSQALNSGKTALSPNLRCEKARAHTERIRKRPFRAVWCRSDMSDPFKRKRLMRMTHLPQNNRAEDW
jgi:hypothetical protein